MKVTNNSLGFIPTMGALHEGHLSLVQAARRDCDKVVVSIFVNPTQFSEGEDFEKYPRDLERDKELLLKEGVDEIWCPTVEEIYPEGLKNVTRIEPPCELTNVLCGVSRPDHFFGVATVVKRLFEKVRPTDVYFGQKDFQQTRVIDWLIQKYFPQIKLHVLPTIREQDGLAMSSRNVYLNKKERELALSLSQSLRMANKLFEQGECEPKVLEQQLRDAFQSYEYAEIRDARSLKKINRVESEAVVAVAAKFGKVRLIDNILLKCL